MSAVFVIFDNVCNLLFKKQLWLVLYLLIITILNTVAAVIYLWTIMEN